MANVCLIFLDEFFDRLFFFSLIFSLLEFILISHFARLIPMD